MAAAHSINLSRADLPASLTAFCRFLRQGGLTVGSGDIVNAISAVSLVGIERRVDFKQALQNTLVIRRDAIPFFNWAFELFWQQPAAWAQAAERLQLLAEARGRPPASADLRHWRLSRSTHPGQGRAESVRPEHESEESDGSPLYSPTEVLRSKNFEDYTREELLQARQWLAANPWSLGLRLTRRQTPGHQRHRLSLRNTLRKSVVRSPDLLRLAWTERKRKPRPIVVLCDISGSMERSTRMLLHFIHSLTTQHHRVETFTFGTRLTRVTRYLKRRDTNAAIGRLGQEVRDWAGGTRIGEALRAFNLHWARRTLGGGAVVLIFSDGWDTGDPQLLEQEVARLHRSCHRLIWLNPNLGYDGYQPLTQGIQTVLPHVDDFLPVHNLQSLFDLGRTLDRRPGKLATMRAWAA
ncbi:MAG: VWA domain-containing protein [Candidatus Marinimicrobia bacterium]|nr:VWA domain-containing protein [Candidatus Neomarinimicrobiota bacterium]